MILTCNQRLVWHLFAGLLTVSGSLLLFCYRFIIQTQVAREVTLANGSAYLDQWLHDSTPVAARFHVFNLSNSQAVEAGEASDLLLREVGPFVFDVLRERRVLRMTETMIDYQPISYYTFNARASRNVSQDVAVHMINIPLAVAMESVRREGLLLKKACAWLAEMSDSRVFTEERTVRQILFEGYKDPLFTLMKLFEETAHLRSASKIPDEFSLMKDVSEL